MKLPRIYTGTDNQSHFEELELPLSNERRATSPWLSGAITAFGYDQRRLRPNIVIGGVEGLGEREWPGACLRIGKALIGVQDLRLRCIMTSFDPDTLIQDKDITHGIYRRFEGKLALNCFVIEGGDISVGDAVELMRGRACAGSAEAADFAD